MLPLTCTRAVLEENFTSRLVNDIMDKRRSDLRKNNPPSIKVIAKAKIRGKDVACVIYWWRLSQTSGPSSTKNIPPQ